MEPHLTATGCHLPYDIGSHSVTIHPTQVNTPALIPARQAGTRFTHPRGMEGWVTYKLDGLPTNRRSPIQVLSLTRPALHGRESNSHPVDHESDALTTASSRLNVGAINAIQYWRNVFLPILVQHWKCWPMLHISLLPQYMGQYHFRWHA